MGFGGFSTRRIQDRYGDEYDVPEDLFIGDESMAREYVIRERAERQGAKPQINRNPFAFVPGLEPIPEPPNPMSNFTRAALGTGLDFGEKVNENLNPLMMIPPLVEDWQKGRYVGGGLLGGLAEAHQQTFQQGVRELRKPFNDPNPYNTAEDIGNLVLGGTRTLASAIPFVGPAASEAANNFGRGEWAKGLGTVTGLGLGALLPKMFGDWNQARKVPTPDMAISDPMIMNDPSLVPYVPPEGTTAAPSIGPMQGTTRPMGTAASTVPERFPNLARLAEMEEVNFPQPLYKPPVLSAEEQALRDARAMRSSFGRVRESQRFGDYEAAAAEALNQPPPGTNATVFGALAPERLTDPSNPFPQDQFGLLPETIREPSVPPNFGIRPPTPPHFGLRPSGSTLGNTPEPIMSEPNAVVRPNAGMIEGVADPNAGFVRRAEVDLTDPVSRGEVPPTPENLTQVGEQVIKEGEANPATRKAAEVIRARKPQGFVERSKILSSGRNLYNFLIGEAQETTLKSFGQGGEELALAAQQSTADSFGFSGKQTAAIRRALAPIKDDKKKQQVLETAIDHIERGTTSTNAAVKRLMEVYRANDMIGTNLYKQSGLLMKNLAGESVPFQPRENYWPHKFDDKTVQKNRPQILAAMMEPDPTTGKAMTLEQAEMALLKGKKTGYGFLDELHARRGDIKGYRKDVDVIKGHYIEMARKAFNDKVFGQIGEKGSFIQDRLDRISQEYGPEARIKAEQIMERYLNKDLPTFDATLMGDIASGMSRLEAITKLGMSTVGNLLGGTAMVGSRARMTTMARAFAESVTAAGRNAAEEMGVLGSLWRDSAQDVGYGSDVSRIYGIAGTEKHLRTFSGLAGKHEANTLFKEIKSGAFRSENKIKQLQDLILEPDMKKVLQQNELSPLQIDRAANRMTDLTQGRADPMNLPRAWSHPNPMVNVVFQFKKYAWIHSRNLKDAIKRNPAAIPRMAGLLLAAGEGVADIRSLVSGKERPEDLQDRLIDNLANSYGAGYVGDLWTAATQDTWQEAMGRLAPLGPASTDITKAVWAAGQGATGMFDEERNFDPSGFNPDPLAEFGISQIPVFGGRLRDEYREW